MLKHASEQEAEFLEWWQSIEEAPMDDEKLAQLLREHCQQYGHEWRDVVDDGQRRTFCVRCSSYES